VHFRRLTFLIVPSPETLALAGRRVLIHEAADGQVEIHGAGHLLPYTVLDKQPLWRRVKSLRTSVSVPFCR